MNHQKLILSENTNDFWFEPKVKYLHNPSSIDFLRECVSSYTPAILKSTMNEWPAYKIWNLEYLTNILGNTPINVSFTQDGLADSVKFVQDDSLNGNAFRFIYPCEERIPFSTFSDMLLHPNIDDAVPYLSSQNDNLRVQFEQLSSSIPETIYLAQDAFGQSEPEAVNLWIGDHRSISSLHKDHFENFYAVIQGTKIFTLFPPTDVAFLPIIDCTTAIYKLKSGEKRSQESCIKKSDLFLSTDGSPSDRISWIPLDPENLDSASSIMWPDYKYSHPVRCEVHAGEVLYIPAMWYHRVSQINLTISVNYWYDQRFDFRFVFYETARALREFPFKKCDRRSRSKSI